MYTAGTLTLMFVTIFAVVVTTTSGMLPPQPCRMVAGSFGRKGLGNRIRTIQDVTPQECGKACVAADKCHAIEWNRVYGYCALLDSRGYYAASKDFGVAEKVCATGK